MTSVAVIGDLDPTAPNHTLIGTAIGHSDYAIDSEPTTVSWIDTPSCEILTSDDLASIDAVWIAPGSPYLSMAGALNAIRLARITDTPLLGTCGGFQHVVLEYARNVIGMHEASHAEYDPGASPLLINALECSLAGTKMRVELQAGTLAASRYGMIHATERYYCNFGLNPQYIGQLQAAGLVVSGVDQNDEPRIVELPDRWFFVGTLFLPQMSSTPERPHPLVTGLLQAARAQGAGTGGPGQIESR